jgi:DnaJ-domain-containing protein 1
MTDCFALLSETRRPWLEAAALKQKFLALSASLHPDKVHSAGAAARSGAAKSFAELNAAHQCLAEPKSRLLHLLELELGAKPKDIQEIPAALADQFAEVAITCRNADQFLAEKSRVTSPLLQVQWFERGQGWVEKLQALQQKLNGLHGRLLAALKTLDGRWMQAEAVRLPAETKPSLTAQNAGSTAEAGTRREILAEAEKLYRLFAYFNRWSGQIQERIVQLSI